MLTTREKWVRRGWRYDRVEALQRWEEAGRPGPFRKWLETEQRLGLHDLWEQWKMDRNETIATLGIALMVAGFLFFLCFRVSECVSHSDRIKGENMEKCLEKNEAKDCQILLWRPE